MRYNSKEKEVLQKLSIEDLKILARIQENENAFNTTCIKKFLGNNGIKNPEMRHLNGTIYELPLTDMMHERLYEGLIESTGNELALLRDDCVLEILVDLLFIDDSVDITKSLKLRTLQALVAYVKWAQQLEKYYDFPFSVDLIKAQEYDNYRTIRRHEKSFMDITEEILKKNPEKDLIYPCRRLKDGRIIPVNGNGGFSQALARFTTQEELALEEYQNPILRLTYNK